MKNPALLPPWKCRDQREADKLIKWTKARLDEEHAICERFITLGEDIRLNPLGNPTVKYAMEVYLETGDKSLIEVADPKLAKHLPQRKPSGKRGGGRLPTSKEDDRIWQAVWDVKLIRSIWREHYGKFYRAQEPDNEQVVTAEQIAKDRHGIKEGSRAEVTFEQRLRKLKAVSSYPKCGA